MALSPRFRLPATTVRRAVFVAGMLLMIGLVWTGLAGSADQFPESHTVGQYAQSAAQLGYGVFGLLTLVTLFQWPRWAGAAKAGWLVAITLAGGLAPIVWGGSPAGTGLLAGGASLLIGIGVLWLLGIGMAGFRGPETPAGVTPASIAALVLCLAAPPAAAQLEISPMIGVHHQRSEQPERIIVFRSSNLVTGDAWQTTAPGSGRAWGGRIGVGIHPRFRLDAIVSYAENDQWAYRLINPLVPEEERAADSSFYTAKLLVSPRLVVDLVKLSSPFRARASMGLSFLRLSGAGRNNLRQTTAAGGAFGFQLMRTLGPRLGVAVDALFPVYPTTTEPMFSFQSPQRATHLDALLFAGLVLRFGHPPCRGTTSGQDIARSAPRCAPAKEP